MAYRAFRGWPGRSRPPRSLTAQSTPGYRSLATSPEPPPAVKPRWLMVIASSGPPWAVPPVGVVSRPPPPSEQPATRASRTPSRTAPRRERSTSGPLAEDRHGARGHRQLLARHVAGRVGPRRADERQGGVGQQLVLLGPGLARQPEQGRLGAAVQQQHEAVVDDPLAPLV